MVFKLGDIITNDGRSAFFLCLKDDGNYRMIYDHAFIRFKNIAMMQSSTSKNEIQTW